MRNNERVVHFYDLQMKSSTGLDGVKSPSCADIDDVLKACVATLAKGYVVKKRGNILIEVVDAAYDNTRKAYHLLINKADKGLGDVTFKNFSDRRTRKGNKTRDEGIESSCHVIIQPNADKRSALVLMTIGAGVSHIHISRIFSVATALLKKAGTHEKLFAFADPSNAIDPNGKPIQYRVRYSYECVGHKDRKLDQALKNGRFLSMDLVSKEVDPFDSNGNLMIESKTIHIEATNPFAITGSFIINAIKKRMKDPKAPKMDTVRLRYKNDAGKTATQSFQPNELEDAFTRKEVVKLETELDPQQTQLNPVIVAAMNDLL